MRPKLLAPSLIAFSAVPFARFAWQRLRRVRRWTRSVEQRIGSVEADVGASVALSLRLSDLDSDYRFGGASISVDGALCLHQLITEADITVVLELGPGTSTSVITNALNRRSDHQAVVVGVEHDDHYMKPLRDRVENLDTAASISLLHAPLARLPNAEGDWYDLQFTNHLRASSVDLLVVDGPPNVRGTGARKPALEQLRPYLASPCYIYVDDYHRTDEHQMVAEWLNLPDISMLRHGHAWALLRLD